MTFKVTDTERSEIRDLYGLDSERNFIKENLLRCKISKDGKYILFEDKVYSTETGEEVPLTEGEWSTSDFLHLGADILSMGIDFVIPGSGAIVDTLNALSYVIEAQFHKDDPKQMNTLYVMGAVTFAFVLMPGALQSAIIPMKRFIKTGKGASSPMVQWGLKKIRQSLNIILTGIPALVRRALRSPLGRRLAKNFGGPKLVKMIDNISGRTKKAFDDVLGKLDAPKKSFLARKGASIKALSKIEMTSLKAFFKSTFRITRGPYILKKFGFKVGKAYAYAPKVGNASVVRIVGISGDVVTIQKVAKVDNLIVKAKPEKIGINNFIEGTIKHPWMLKGFRESVPFFIKSFARYVLPDVGDMNYKELESVPDLNPDQTSMDSLAYMHDELPAYQGDTGVYTVNQTVKDVQNALIMLNYSLPRAGVDGKFGPETSMAIQKFQTDNDLEPTGRLNRMTVQRMAINLKEKGIPNSEDLQVKLANL